MAWQLALLVVSFASRLICFFLLCLAGVFMGQSVWAPFVLACKIVFRPFFFKRHLHLARYIAPQVISVSPGLHIRYCKISVDLLVLVICWMSLQE